MKYLPEAFLVRTINSINEPLKFLIKEYTNNDQPRARATSLPLVLKKITNRGKKNGLKSTSLRRIVRKEIRRKPKGRFQTLSLRNLAKTKKSAKRRNATCIFSMREFSLD